jgi:hypothetical protein
MDDIVFIFPVCIKKPKHSILWKECVRCIRKFYSNKIIIIIDNCDIEDLNLEYSLESYLNDHNIMFIKSEFNGAGELLPYYYYLLLKPSSKAIIIQDSIFIQKPFDEKEINEVNDIKFLWHFEFHKTEYYRLVLSMLTNLNHDQELIELYKNENKWDGCAGLSSIITLKFLEKIQEKYLFLNLLNYFNDETGNDKFRILRCTLERILAIICFNELKWNVEHKFKFSLLGSIISVPHFSGYTYEMYKKDINNKNENSKIQNLQIIKCWNGR